MLFVLDMSSTFEVLFQPTCGREEVASCLSAVIAQCCDTQDPVSFAFFNYKVDAVGQSL